MNISVNASDLPDDTSTIMIPPEAFENGTNETMSGGVVFSMFSSPDLYPLDNETRQNFSIASNVMSATVIGMENKIFSNITIVLQLNFPVCAWNKYFAAHNFISATYSIGCFFPTGISSNRMCFLG